jgi:hypothetical protein
VLKLVSAWHAGNKCNKACVEVLNSSGLEQINNILTIHLDVATTLCHHHIYVHLAFTEIEVLDVHCGLWQGLPTLDIAKALKAWVARALWNKTIKTAQDIQDQKKRSTCMRHGWREGNLLR